MDKLEKSYYAAADKAIQAMNRENLEAFGRLKMAKWDQINVIRTVVSVYREAAMRARRRYYEVAFEAYVLGLTMCGEEPRKAHAMAEKAITPEWIDKILDRVDPVSMFRFTSETERKAYKTAETLEVANDRDTEINKALRFWSQQLGQYAIIMTDNAVLQAFEDYGTEYVMWIAEKDQRTCRTCKTYDGQVFELEDLPDKPHFGCRCRFRPVAERKAD